MEEALNRELSLQHGDSIDAFMPTEQVMNRVRKIDRLKEKQIATIEKDDPDFASKVEEIEKRAK